jgi:hypothetical protein
VTYAELRPGDVLMRDGRPLYVVIRCSVADNEFAWLPLVGERAGHLLQPDLARVEMWHISVNDFNEAFTVVSCS